MKDKWQRDVDRALFCQKLAAMLPIEPWNITIAGVRPMVSYKDLDVEKLFEVFLEKIVPFDYVKDTFTHLEPDSSKRYPKGRFFGEYLWKLRGISRGSTFRFSVHFFAQLDRFTLDVSLELKNESFVGKLFPILREERDPRTRRVIKSWYEDSDFLNGYGPQKINYSAAPEFERAYLFPFFDHNFFQDLKS